MRDVAALVAGIANHSGLNLSHHDAEDLRHHLLIECWKLSERFEPERGSGSAPTRRRRFSGASLTGTESAWAGRNGGGATAAPTNAKSPNSSPTSKSSPAMHTAAAENVLPKTNTAAVDWDALSPNSVWTLQHLAIPLWQGSSARELAQRHQTTTRSVNLALGELRR